MAKHTSAYRRHMSASMRRYYAGRMHSGARRGPIVHQHDQAVAISLTEARAKHLRGAPPAPK
jgi:Family of unknown function (DUF6496)